MVLLSARKTDERFYETPTANSVAVSQSNNTVPPSTPKFPTRQTITLRADELWLDSGISVSQGDTLSVSATGQWSNSGNEKFVNADGYNNGWPGIILESGHIAQLIGKIGNNIFAIGQHYAGRSPSSGRLFLSMNDVPSHFDDNFGSLVVSITTANAPMSGQSNVPTVKQMQDDVEKELKKMVDEVNR
jgi:adhesin HecA-like repeat protein